MSIFSTTTELDSIRKILSNYMRLPFSGDTIPGAVMEAALAEVRGATRLNTYDFVDVYSADTKVGWQVKSTKESTPVTWKRAKIPNQTQLIDGSKLSATGLQVLGDAIIEFFNAHAQESMRLYGLSEIGYARLIIKSNGEVTYFERSLCSIEVPNVFNSEDFEWRWSSQKQGRTKEQLSSLHGYSIKDGKKWWAWHGLGENQLHFSGEANWWPTTQDHATRFSLPSDGDRVPLERLVEFLEAL